MSDIEAAYQEEFRRAAAEGKEFPSRASAMRRIDEIIDKKMEEPSTLQGRDD